MNLKRHQSVKVPVNNGARHDLSHQHLTTIDFFRLQPIGCFECIAGDSFSLNVRSLIEAAPLATKVYGSCHLDLHSFFVPFRLLWSDWNNYYYGDGSNDSFSLPSVIPTSVGFKGLFSPINGTITPTIKLRRAVFGSLGYPVLSTFLSTYNTPLSLLPARAYQQVWWDWFRDSVNITESTKPSYLYTVGGDRSGSSDLSKAFVPRFRSFRKDYITTLLTSQNAAVEGNSSSAEAEIFCRAEPGMAGLSGQTVYSNFSKSFAAGASVSSTDTSRHVLSSLTIPALRGAASLQRFLERLGITGTRPLERIKSTFGLQPSPERLDMSEFIGYKSIPIGIDGLTNTGSSYTLDGENGSSSNAFLSSIDSNGSVPYGYQSGRSMSSGQSDTWHYNATEHGYIMIIASVIPDYINGSVVDPLFTRGLSASSQGPIDFFQPDLDGVGYRPVTVGQLIAPTSDSPGWTPKDNVDYDAVVGYQPYGEDYRFIFDKISGDFNEPSSRNIMRNLAFVRDLTETHTPAAVVAGLNLTTPSVNDVSSFDNHFQISSSDYDHFVLNNYFAIDAVRPVSSAELPTELSDLANKTLISVDKNGIRS